MMKCIAFILLFAVAYADQTIEGSVAAEVTVAGASSPYHIPDAPGTSASSKRIVDYMLNSGKLMDDYLVEHIARHGTKGYIPLCIAENRLMYDILLPALKKSAQALTADDLPYVGFLGTEEFAEALADFMGEYIFHREVDSANIQVYTGSSLIVEMLMYSIADAGEGIIVPTPFYPGFKADIMLHDALKIVPLPRTEKDGWRITRTALETVRINAERQGTHVRAVLMTSPDNPLGITYSEKDFEEIFDFLILNPTIHLVVDEVYALSVFPGAKHTSVGSLLDKLSNRVHLIWAFSKDFCINGFRVGVLYTENLIIQQGLMSQGTWLGPSSGTMAQLTALISDKDWTKNYVATLSQRIGTAYDSVTGYLKKEGIPFLPSNSALFIVLDLRTFMPHQSFDAETVFFHRMVNETNVNIIPGKSAKFSIPGFFRVCFTSASTDVVLGAMEKVVKFLKSLHN